MALSTSPTAPPIFQAVLPFIQRWGLEITIEREQVIAIRAVPSSQSKIVKGSSPSWWGDFLHTLNAYRHGHPVDFRWIPLAWDRLRPYDARVLSTLQTHVPWGRTLTYGELARRVGSSPRAVGGSLKRNPWLVVVPCHRVTASRGLGGFASGVALKRILLALEGVYR